jgi:NADH:ubiquinone oxidoreductase subunit K
MKALKTLGIIEIVLVAITILCVASQTDNTTTGFWALALMGVAVAQSIVGICAKTVVIRDLR